jgi:hypothetical protein
VIYTHAEKLTIIQLKFLGHPISTEDRNIFKESEDRGD